MDDRKMFYGANKKVFKKAFMLRACETETEKLLWQRLNKNQLCGFRFKRQHPIAHFVVDFYCHKAKLVIELDGEYHNKKEQQRYDDNRTEILAGLGLRILRFSDENVIQNIDGVVETIKKNLV